LLDAPFLSPEVESEEAHPAAGGAEDDAFLLDAPILSHAGGSEVPGLTDLMRAWELRLYCLRFAGVVRDEAETAAAVAEVWREKAASADADVQKTKQTAAQLSAAEDKLALLKVSQLKHRFEEAMSYVSSGNRSPRVAAHVAVAAEAGIDAAAEDEQAVGLRKALLEETVQFDLPSRWGGRSHDGDLAAVHAAVALTTKLAATVQRSFVLHTVATQTAERAVTTWLEEPL
jgi:hypothetical protein